MHHLLDRLAPAHDSDHAVTRAVSAMPVGSGMAHTLDVRPAALVAAATLVGCGSGGGPSTNTAPPAPSSTAVEAAQAHNQADVTFVQGMIPHHSQAVDMSKPAAQHASSPQVKDLAGRIEAAQQPEIDQMNGMLRAWNASMSSPNGPSMSGMNHSNMGNGSMGQGGMGQMSHAGMPGMMSDSQMQQLNQAKGASFDKAFLQMVIAHHDGAVTTSEIELKDRQNPAAKALAQRIIDAQQREIAGMQGMLAK